VSIPFAHFASCIRYASKLVQEHIPAKDKRKGALLRFRVAVSGFGMLADHCDDPTTHGRRIGSATSFVHHNCNRGRQLQLVNFRKWTMHMLGLDPNARPRKQRVLIWDRAASDYKPNRKVRGLPELKKRIETELQVRPLSLPLFPPRRTPWNSRGGNAQAVPAENPIRTPTHARVG
jgi:hypothetical protein